MKKLYTIVASGLFAFSGLSQAPVISGSSQSQVQQNPAFLGNPSRAIRPTSISSSRATTITKQRVNAIDEIVNYYGYTSPDIGYTNPIFVDSMATIQYSGPSYGTPWLYGVAQVFDFDGIAFKGGTFDPAAQPFDAGTDMVIDSIAIGGYYNRIDANTSLVDTAIIRVVSANGNFAGGGYFSNPDSNKMVIEMSDINTNSYTGVLYEHKIPMDAAFANDTLSNGSIQFKAVPNLTLTGHLGLVAVILDYKPGRTHTLADTIFVNCNNIGAIYATPAGTGLTYPNGFGPDQTIGQFFDQNVKWSGGALDYMLPAIAFTGDHPYQLYDVDLTISQTNNLNASIDELENGAKLFQNFPNPATGLTTIKYSLANSATVSFEVFDVTGKAVFTSLEGNKAEGTHSINLDTRSLKAGVYFYSVAVNGNKLTKKLTVTK